MRSTPPDSRAPGAGSATDAGTRLPVLQPDQLTPAQHKTLDAILSGPRAAGDPNAVTRLLKGGPFNAWLRSPELGDRLQRVGAYIRYDSSLPLRLNEFAILITARVWTSQYEWFAHHPIALRAGLDPRLAEELAQGKRPQAMADDEAAVHDFCLQLHREKQVDDVNYQRVLELFGERGVVDLIGVCGYYTAVSMTLNVARVALPEGTEPPLKPLG